ncbi:MAG: hypothetical protein IJD92_04795 [Bacilli bacterium]|nr:hypothetical protein [Bacilli bacterium]
MKDKLKSVISTILALILGFTIRVVDDGNDKNKHKDEKNAYDTVSEYNSDFDPSELPFLTVEQADEVEFNNKITYYDIVNIIELVSKSSDSNEVTLDKYLKILNADKAYKSYIIARKQGNDIKQTRKALGNFEDIVLKAHILRLYQIDPENFESIKIEDKYFGEYAYNGENYEGQTITITYKEYKESVTLPGGIVEEKIVKPEKKVFDLSIERKQLKRINKLLDGKEYDFEEIDSIMEKTLKSLYYDSHTDHFQPTSYGEKNFDYLVYEVNEEVYKKVKSLSSVLETETKEDKKISRATKINYLMNLKKAAQSAKQKELNNPNNFSSNRNNSSKNVSAGFNQRRR